MTDPRQCSGTPDHALAAAAFAVDPAGTGGIAIRSRAGPGRDRWLARLRALLPPSAPVRRLPPHVADGRLLGGLDLAATLRWARPVVERGILAEADGGIVLIAMAERLAPATVARLAACLDAREVMLERDGFHLRLPARFGVIALDEGIDEERPSPVLLDRLAFHLDLDAVEVEPTVAPPDRESIEAAQSRISLVGADDRIVEAICGAAVELGIWSLRPALQALQGARAIAALLGHDTIQPEDAAAAARLVLAPRATRLPAAPPETEQSADTTENAAREPGAGDEPPREADGPLPLDDIVLSSARAAIPPGLLARLRLPETERSRSGSSGRAGAPRESVAHGRPAGVRRGEPRGGNRLNVIETLRAAAPWQRLRRDSIGRSNDDRIAVRPDDFRIIRLKRRSETTTIFVVDASGSSAMNRLAEAKGAVELLLAECYVRRDQVALVAFRGKGATLLLPATRSLARARRCLAGLRGGGGTPLAAGINAGAALADAARRAGRTPVIIVMTDGRANIDRSGRAGRVQANSDATEAAHSLRRAGVAAMLVDTSPNPRHSAARLAVEMGARYMPLPHADAGALSRGVRSALLPAASR